jgi:hypothetical protein
MAFFEPSPDHERVAHEGLQQLGPARRIEGLALLPQRREMAAIVARRDLVDGRPLGAGAPEGRVGVRRRRQHQPMHPVHEGSGQFDRDHATRVMPHHVRTRNAQRIEQLDRDARPLLDARRRRAGIGITEARGVHCHRPEARAKQRKHVPVLGPAARRLVQQQHRLGARIAATRVVHLPDRQVREGAADLHHGCVLSAGGCHSPACRSMPSVRASTSRR